MSKVLDLERELVKKLEEDEKDNKIQLSELNPGDTFKVEEYDFIVLEQENGTTKVISKDIMVENVCFDENKRDYNKSNLKKMIETDIQPIIENAVGGENLVEHTASLTSADMQNEFGDLVCKIRPITFDESRLYNNLLVNKNLNSWWWTCTPWSTEDRGWKFSIAVVAPSGFICDFLCCGSGGVRPFCILKSKIFVSKGK